jgi:DNA-binding transcriptional regulator PaaX
MKNAITAEVLLELLFWTLDKLSRPTFINLTESFETWEYRAKIKPGLKNLAASNYITVTGRGARRTLILTEQGRLAVLGGMDPVARWERSWDRKWRVFIFDLPAAQAELRKRLWRWLRSERFGYLQQSVWISPDPIDNGFHPLKHLDLSPERYTVIEGRPGLPDDDDDLVRAAWDFAVINRAYADMIALCEHVRSISTPLSLTQRQHWLAEVRQLWLKAVSLDPLLPQVLWPTGYLGRQAYQIRATTIAHMIKIPK